MFTSVADMVKALAEMGKGLVSFLETNKEKQVETVVIKDRENLKRATNITEEIINNSDGFFSWTARLCWDIMDKTQRRQFIKFFKTHKKLKKRFNKVD